MAITPLSDLELEKIKGWSPTKPVTVSDGEMNRRWTATRKSMEEHGIDVLVVHGAGYQQWFTESARNHVIVFPRDDDMTVVGEGPFGTDVQSPPGLRGVRRRLAWPNSGEAPFARVYDADLLEKVLEPYASAAIGLVGTAPYDTTRRLETRMTEATFVPADELVDAIKLVKSDEEWELIMRTAEMHDRAMETAFAYTKPGMRSVEVARIADYIVRSYGCVTGPCNAGSAPIGTPARFGTNPQKPLEAGDQISFLLECAGPGGMWTEIGRTAVIGKATDAMLEEIEFTKKAQQFSASLLKPGALCKDIFAEYNQFMRDNGRPEERRIHSHGQGYDLLERPLIRADETTRVQASMNFAVHPTYDRNGYHSWLCDNYRVRQEGVTRINQLEQKIFEIDA